MCRSPTPSRGSSKTRFGTSSHFLVLRRSHLCLAVTNTLCIWWKCLYNCTNSVQPLLSWRRFFSGSPHSLCSKRTLICLATAAPGKSWATVWSCCCHSEANTKSLIIRDCQLSANSMWHFWFGIEQGCCSPPDLHAINALQKLTNVILGDLQGLLKNAAGWSLISINSDKKKSTWSMPLISLHGVLQSIDCR